MASTGDPAVGDDEGADTLSSARSRTGALSVTTTPQGLPVAVHIEPPALRRGEDVLAAQILGLCRQSALVAGVRLRERLTTSVAGREVADVLGLPTVDALVRDEEFDDAEADATASWLRQV